MKTRDEARRMANKLSAFYTPTARLIPGTSQRVSIWADTLRYYSFTGKCHTATDANRSAVLEAWAWINDGITPLDGYEKAYNGPTPTTPEVK